MSGPSATNGRGQTKVEEVVDFDLVAMTRGVQRAEEKTPPADHVRRVAATLLLIFGASIVLVLLLTTVTAWLKPTALKDLIGFYSTVVATLGTLVGGVVAFYFARR